MCICYIIVFIFISILYLILCVFVTFYLEKQYSVYSVTV
jgi:hypothetical protein